MSMNTRPPIEIMLVCYSAGSNPAPETNLNHVFAYVNFNKMLYPALGLSIVQNLALYKKRIHHTHIHSS